MCEDMSKTDYVQLMKYSLLMKKHPFSALPSSTYTDKKVHSADSEGDEHKCKKGRRKSGSKKHRAGKNQKRKYKPYHKLTSAEREKVDERISRRSSLKRAFLHSCGVPLAPLNTTQFLVNDSIDASENEGYAETDDLRSPDDFLEMWSHRFEHLSHTDLVEWHLSLEEEVERLQEDLEVEQRILDLEVEQKILVFEGEVRRYECEIAALRKLNEKLIKRVKDLPCKDELAKILEEFPVYGEKHRHLEEDDSPCKDELPEILKDFPVDDEKVIDAKDHLHLEEDNSSSKDEFPKILEDFPVKEEKVVSVKVLHLEEGNLPCKDEILDEFHVYDEIDEKYQDPEEDNLPCKDELPEILDELHVYAEEDIDEKYQDPEEDNLSCQDELAKIPKDFPVEDKKVEKDRHLEEGRLSVAPLSNEACEYFLKIYGDKIARSVNLDAEQIFDK